MNKNGGSPLAPQVGRHGRSRGGSNTGIPCRGRKRGARSGRRRPERVGFGNQIQCVAKVANELTQFGEYGLYRDAKVGPELVVRGVPEGLGGGRPPLGLSSLSNSQDTHQDGENPTPTEERGLPSGMAQRHGLKGMPRTGKRFIGQFCTLAEQIKKLMAMWTVNLPTGWYLHLKETKLWPLFQRRLIDHLTQYLKEHGDIALVLGVVELGPKRGDRTGRPYPHLHIVTSGWGARREGGGWLISPQVMDGLVVKALTSCGLRVEGALSSSNVDGIKQSVKSYLRAYLKKQVGVPDLDLSGGWDELVPRQWWNRSSGARRLVDGHCFRLPSLFVYWMLKERTTLEDLKLGIGGISVVGTRRTLTAERPIEIEYFRFASPAAIARAIELWLLYERDPWSFREEVRVCLGSGDLDRQNSEHAASFSRAAMCEVPEWLDVLRDKTLIHG